MQNISFDECVALLKSLSVAPMGTERVFLSECVGRVLCEDILATSDNPKFHTSNMDGYAFNSADLGDLQSVGLKIASVNKAGNAESCAIQKGECIKTFTGAKMPQNADCLAIVEQVEVKNESIFLITESDIKKDSRGSIFDEKSGLCSHEQGNKTDSSIDEASGKLHDLSHPAGCKALAEAKKDNARWNHIRKVGENYKQGDILLPKNTILTPFSIPILAQNHNILLSVYRRIRIGVLSGGDELIELGEIPKSQNYIYSSNNHALCAIVRALGAKPTLYPLLQDSPEHIRESIANALKDNDIVITTGGMSKGDFDFTKDIIREFGECVFSGVRIKPGKVIAHIKCGDDKHIFALPGNPSSSIVSFLLFGRIIMQKMLCQTPQIPIKKGKLLCDIDNSNNDRLCFDIADLSIDEGFYAVLPRKNRSSYMINDFSGAFCILAQKSYQKGDFVDIILLDDLLKL